MACRDIKLDLHKKGLVQKQCWLLRQCQHSDMHMTVLLQCLLLMQCANLHTHMTDLLQHYNHHQSTYADCNTRKNTC